MSNIAEGRARQHIGEFRHFLSISNGSLAELDTQRIIAERMGFISPARSGDLDQRITEIRKMLMGFTYARMGGREKAMEIVGHLKALPPGKYVSPVHIARVYVGLGDKDRAFEWLEKSYQGRDYNLPYVRVDPTFDGLRIDPRYAGLVQRIGLP